MGWRYPGPSALLASAVGTLELCLAGGLPKGLDADPFTLPSWGKGLVLLTSSNL